MSKKLAKFMKISITCKLDSAGAYGFIKPISDIIDISTIDVFRDINALSCKKVKYHTSFKNRNGIIGQFSKLLKMIRIINKNYSLSIGFYEIPHGLLAFMIGKIYNIPTVISIIGNPDYTKIRKGLRKKITYFMYKRIQAITVTGSKSKRVLIRNGIDPNKIFTLPNSINVDKFVSLPDVEKEYDIISLGRLSSEKELGNLLKIISILKESIPNIKVGIAGKGPEKGRLEKKILDLSLQTNVNLLGLVDNIVDFYNSGKVFVLTSRTEGLPRTVIEAMACGVPCVSSNVGDIQDIIEDNINGYLIEDYRKLKQFIKRVETLLTDKKKYVYFSENSIKNINEKFSYQAATAVWEKIIKKIE